MKWITKLWLLITTISVLFCCLNCKGERYRKDRRNKMTRKSEKASHFHAKQAVKLTQENIDNRDINEKSSRKKVLKQQEILNDANKRSSKAKKSRMHSGNFKFY